jgi:MFS family permease
LLATAVGLLVLFVVIEVRTRTPLVPLALLRLRSLATANALGMLWAAAMFAWFFLAALYLQLVLGYSPLHVGLAFLPANLIMAAFSIGLSAKLVIRLGTRTPIIAGLLLVAAGLALFAHAPVGGRFLTDVMPSMVLLGIGAGMALNPVMLAATSDVAPEHAGVASGLVNTAIQMGGALGLAILASIASSETTHLTVAGNTHSAALTGGYHAAFLAGTVFAVLAAALAATLARPGEVRDPEPCPLTPSCAAT